MKSAGTQAYPGLENRETQGTRLIANCCPYGKLTFRMVPFVPTIHPFCGLANATAQYPVTPGSVFHVVPSSGVQAAPPMSAVITT